MLSFDDALDILRQAARALGVESVAIGQAAGRVLAAPVIAAIDSPRSHVSAMDGFAVRSADLVSFPVTLRIAGESFPGAGWPGIVERGSCARIFTGAPLPAGSDRIVIQEEVRREGDAAIIDSAPGPKTWVRPRGSDFSAGNELLTVGRLLDPAALIAAAGGDLAEVDVFVRPRLALMATGDELVAPGRAREGSQAVPDSVTLGIAAFAEQWGAQVVGRARIGDDLAALEKAAQDAADQADIVLVTGGASIGERDFAKAMFEPLGLDLLFSKISIRPGKPAWLGRIGEKLVLGLPGNPTSALVTARLLLAPLLCALQGRPIEQALHWEPARLAGSLPACDARETFHRARLAAGEATPLSFQESHAQKVLADANALIRQAAHSSALAEGASVQLLRL